MRGGPPEEKSQSQLPSFPPPLHKLDKLRTWHQNDLHRRSVRICLFCFVEGEMTKKKTQEIAGKVEEI